jgi:group I intron endonuclease
MGDTMYIYKIENRINNKIYIGQSTKPIKESDDYFGSGILIQKAIKKYGITNFNKTILCKCKTITELNEKEIYYISKYKSNEDGYNISKGGNGGNLGDKVNTKISNTVKDLWKNGYYDNIDWSLRPSHPQTEETIEKIKKSQSGENGYWYGKLLSNEHKEKIQKNTKIAFTKKETKQKFLEAMRSPEVREKISKTLKGSEPWNKGKTGVYTDEQIKKMSESAKNRKIDEKTESQRRNKISKYFTETHPNKIKILDNRDGVIYDSLRDFCIKTNTSWYKTKKMRKENLIKEITNEGC